MFLLKTALCSLLALSAPIHAWGWKETEAEKTERIEREQKFEEQRAQYEQKIRATGHVKTNFRLESSYNALKEARKTMACFVLAWPVLTAIVHQFDAELSKTYAYWIPHSLAALFVLWGTENILRGQVELNKQQYADTEAIRVV